MGKYSQGEFEPKNKEKYLGNRNPIYRSGWEKKFMVMLDTSPNITQWCSECVTINYFDKANNKPRNYIPDFYIMNNEGKKFIIEIKPQKEIQKPSVNKPLKTQKQKLQHLNEIKTYITNVSKWEHAKKYCDMNGIEFKLLTEEGCKFF